MVKFTKATLATTVRPHLSKVSATSALSALTLTYVRLVSPKALIATILSLRLERLLRLQFTLCVSIQAKTLTYLSLQCT